MTDPYNVENRLNQLERIYNPVYPSNIQSQNQRSQPTPVIMVDWVTGVDGVRSYPVRFGSSVLLIDHNANKMYLKTLDQIGTVSISAYSYTQIKLPTQEDKPTNDMSAFNDRLTKLEDILIKLTTKEGDTHAVESTNVKPDGNVSQSNATNKS